MNAVSIVFIIFFCFSFFLQNVRKKATYDKIFFLQYPWYVNIQPRKKPFAHSCDDGPWDLVIRSQILAIANHRMVCLFLWRWSMSAFGPYCRPAQSLVDNQRRWSNGPTDNALTIRENTFLPSQITFPRPWFQMGRRILVSAVPMTTFTFTLTSHLQLTDRQTNILQGNLVRESLGLLLFYQNQPRNCDVKKSTAFAYADLPWLTRKQTKQKRKGKTAKKKNQPNKPITSK